MEVTTITCDTCAKDLTGCDSGSDEYRLHLLAGRLANTSNYRFAIDFPPPLARPHHFCDWKCLSEFVEKKAPVSWNCRG